MAPTVRPIPQQPTVDVEVNLAAAQSNGLRPGDIRRDATTLTSGLIVGNLYEQSKIFDVVVWGAPATRSDLTELGNLLIDTPSGGQVALKDVATVSRPRRRRSSTTTCSRSVEVAASVTGDPPTWSPTSDPASVGSDAVRVPRGGVRERHRAPADRPDPGLRARSRVGIFLLLQAAAGSWRRAALLLLPRCRCPASAASSSRRSSAGCTPPSLTGLFAVLALAIRACVLLGRRIAELERGRRRRGAPSRPRASARCRCCGRS